jgi:hypothetical protein
MNPATTPVIHSRIDPNQFFIGIQLGEYLFYLFLFLGGAAYMQIGREQHFIIGNQKIEIRRSR